MNNPPLTYAHLVEVHCDLIDYEFAGADNTHVFATITYDVKKQTWFGTLRFGTLNQAQWLVDLPAPHVQALTRQIPDKDLPPLLRKSLTADEALELIFKIDERLDVRDESPTEDTYNDVLAILRRIDPTTKLQPKPRSNLDQLLDCIHVDPEDSNGMFTVVDENSEHYAKFSNETDAFRYRLDLINRKLNP